MVQVFRLKNWMGQHFLQLIGQTLFSVEETLKTESSVVKVNSKDCINHWRQVNILYGLSKDITIFILEAISLNYKSIGI